MTPSAGPDNARRAVRAALLKGTLERPSACSACGKKCKPQGHHRDYQKPLDVMWLCIPCHAAEHREERRVCAVARRASKEPATALARWMRENGKTITALCRAARITYPTARSYVDGYRSKTIDARVPKAISDWTGGAVSEAAVAGARHPSAAQPATEAA